MFPGEISLARVFKHPCESVLYLTVSVYLTVSGFSVHPFLYQSYVFITFRFLFVFVEFYTLFHGGGHARGRSSLYVYPLSSGGVPPTPTYDLDASRALLDLRENGQFQPPPPFFLSPPHQVLQNEV